MLLKKYNFALLIFPILIFSLGIITLLSTSPDQAKSQILFFVIGMVFYFIISTIDYTLMLYYWKILYASIVGLLALTYFTGILVGGSVRWLKFGSFNLQPSEFAKVVLIISLASLLVSAPNLINSLKHSFKLILFVLPLIGLVLLQPDLGTTLVILGTFVGILFFAGLSNWYFFTAFVFAGIFSTPAWSLMQPYQRERILVFFNPALDVLGSGYNVIQSVIAVGSGGFWGQGYGRGTQSHLKFLPAYWTDFIFASFAEEWGFVGVVMLLLLFVFLLVTLLYISYSVEDVFGSLLSIGAFMVFFLQFLINIGMNIGIMPVTGIPLPMVSYGGSSLLSSLFLLGIIQSVWVYRKH